MTELTAASVADRPTIAAMVKQIDEAAERGARLVQRLLSFARKQPQEKRVLDLNDTIKRAADMLRHTLGEHINLETVLAPEPWHSLADPFQLEAAIVNLSTNARDAMPNGGRLLIETANVHLDEHYAAQNADASPGDHVAVIVTDSGTGMPPEVVERVFEPFFTTKEIGRGTGLGLSMVYGFAKQSGGHVKIYSEIGHGTSIRLYLPKVAEQAASTGEALAGPRPDTRGVRHHPRGRGRPCRAQDGSQCPRGSRLSGAAGAGRQERARSPARQHQPHRSALHRYGHAQRGQWPGPHKGGAQATA
jgi:signal transduction histidine kinase